MIPDQKRDAVSAALRSAFGVAIEQLDEIRPLTEGMSSAHVFRIGVRGRAYALRMVAYGDPTREYACMQAAAAAQIAPRVHYASVAERVAIIDFVEARPLPPDMLALLAPLVARLHALRPFPKVIEEIAAVEGFVQRVRAAGVELRAGDLHADELFDRFAELAAVYPRDAELVASHDDLKPQNVLYDGRRLWLVDWEAAFLNDRFFDLAVAGNFFARDDAEHARFAALYLGRTPSDVERARALLVRVTCHVSYAALFALLAARGGAPIDAAPAADFRAFHDGLISGAEDTRDAATKLRYAKVHLVEGLRLVRAARFRDALERCRE